MTYHHAGDQPVYAPNSYNGPEADPSKELPTWRVEAAELGRYTQQLHSEDDDFGQAGTLVRDVMDDTDREHLANNIIAHASNRVSTQIQDRVIQYWTNVDPDLGKTVATALEGHAVSASAADGSGPNGRA
jgi:catalase